MTRNCSRFYALRRHRFIEMHIRMAQFIHRGVTGNHDGRDMIAMNLKVIWGMSVNNGEPKRSDPQPSLLMLGHPFAGHALGFGDLVAGHRPGEIIPVVLRILVTLCGSEVEPHIRKHIV